MKMPMKLCFILIVLINSGIHFNHGEVIRGVDIKRINVKSIVGKWYLLASSKIQDLNLCVTCSVELLTGDNFRISVTMAPKVNLEYIHEFVLNATMRQDSNIIHTIRSNSQPGPLIIMFNLGFDAYVGLFVGENMDALTVGRHASVYIIGRDKTLPDGILEDAKESDFYQEGVNPFDGFFGVNPSSCVL